MDDLTLSGSEFQFGNPIIFELTTETDQFPRQHDSTIDNDVIFSRHRRKPMSGRFLFKNVSVTGLFVSACNHIPLKMMIFQNNDDELCDKVALRYAT